MKTLTRNELVISILDYDKMDNLRTIATFLRKQLTEIESEIKRLEENLLTPEEMRQKVADIHPTFEWKMVVMRKYGPVDNIIEILNDCYSSFFDEVEDGNVDAIIGKLNSWKWQEFQLKVIAKLLVPGVVTDYFDDTANGCDELVWDAGLEVIKELAT
jgi:hypothetical protein